MNKNIGYILSVLSFNFVVASAWGNPLGGVVGSGAAAITTAGNTLTIGQSSSTSIINWSSFNILSGETTWFQFRAPARPRSIWWRLAILPPLPACSSPRSGRADRWVGR